jgi:hypothetical protein
MLSIAREKRAPLTKRHRKQPREWIAMLATFVLLVHAAVAGIADGAMASPQLLDAFGNVICTSHGAEQGPATPNQPSHSHLPECCLASCTVVGGHAVPPAAPSAVPPTLAGQVKIAVPEEIATATAFELSPFNPRAPPLPV